MVKEACTAPTHSIPGSAEALKQNNTRPMMESQLQIPAVLPWPFPKLQGKAEESPAPPLPAPLPHDPLLKRPCLNLHRGCTPGKGAGYVEGNRNLLLMCKPEAPSQASFHHIPSWPFPSFWQPKLLPNTPQMPPWESCLLHGTHKSQQLLDLFVS